jgi:hypothetical protein
MGKAVQAVEQGRAAAVPQVAQPPVRFPAAQLVPRVQVRSLLPPVVPPSAGPVAVPLKAVQLREVQLREVQLREV